MLKNERAKIGENPKGYLVPFFFGQIVGALAILGLGIVLCG